MRAETPPSASPATRHGACSSGTPRGTGGREPRGEGDAGRGPGWRIEMSGSGTARGGGAAALAPCPAALRGCGRSASSGELCPAEGWRRGRSSAPLSLLPGPWELCALNRGSLCSGHGPRLGCVTRRGDPPSPARPHRGRFVPLKCSRRVGLLSASLFLSAAKLNPDGASLRGPCPACCPEGAVSCPTPLAQTR